MKTSEKSSVEEIRRRFDGDVERFSNLATGQVATVDALACLDLVARAAAAATPGAAEVLDIGCGAGNYSLKLREHLPAARFTLVDLSQPMLTRAAERLGSSIRETVAGDIRELQFAPGRFDVIVAAAVFHHLRTPAEWEATFAACHRWLKPGGSLWIFDLVAHEHPAIQALLWSGYGRYLEEQGGAAYRDKVLAYVEREDTPASLPAQLALLTRVGFAEVDVLHKHSCFAAFGGVRR
jgi:tRNA (cmo5U34)-methyltransferase